MPGRLWTQREIDYLAAAKADSIPAPEIARVLNRSPDAVAHKAGEIGARRAPDPPERRFWRLVDKCGPDECWPWLGGTDRKGYGRFNASVPRTARRSVTASRYAWELEHGDPREAAVLHHCDNPSCCNPRHLFLGTLQDNNADALAKGRHAHGERHGFAKLTEAQVRMILAMLREGSTRTAAARRFGVVGSTVDAIANGKTWRHVHLPDCDGGGRCRCRAAIA